MAKTFTLYDNREYFFDIEQFDNCSLIKEGYSGFRAIEKEDNNDVFIYYKDIKNNDEVERSFIIKKNQLDEIRKMNCYYDQNIYSKYKKLLELSKNVIGNTLNDRYKVAEKVFEKNKLFFIAINISLNE